jgi:hypothetical protein
MPKHKSEDYKLSAVNYYLTENNNQLQTCKIFKCSRRSLMRWVNKYKQSNQILRQNRIPVAYKYIYINIKYIYNKFCLFCRKTVPFSKLSVNILFLPKPKLTNILSSSTCFSIPLCVIL